MKGNFEGLEMTVYLDGALASAVPGADLDLRHLMQLGPALCIHAMWSILCLLLQLVRSRWM